VIDGLPFAEQVTFDSVTKQDDPRCLEGTRTEVLKEIRAWAYGNERSHIYWLSGAAGTGKSTIARTIAYTFNTRHELGASFFFVRGGGDAGHTGKFFTSIARQLAMRFPELEPHVAGALRQQRDLLNKDWNTLWKMLIEQPLKAMRPSGDRQTLIVIVIDALDECDDDKDIKRLIDVLTQSETLADDANNCLHTRLRIVITSRPETPIQACFRGISNTFHRDLLLHDMARDVVDGDIRLFINSQFEEIKNHKTWLRNWPPSIETVNLLVHISGGLFIFAATVCRFVAAEEHPERALQTFLNDGNRLMGEPRNLINMKSLHQMYGQVLLKSTTSENQAILQEILGAIATLCEPLHPSALARLLGLDEDDVHLRLQGLQSVVRMPGRDESPVRLFHTSFGDFLFDTQRLWAANSRKERPLVHSQLLEACVVAMEACLKRDICGLRRPGVSVTEVDRMALDERIPEHVQYACRYWPEHFKAAGIEGTRVASFLRKHLLHWWEVMSLIKKLSESLHMLRDLEQCTKVSGLFQNCNTGGTHE
jgi:hypothetical protein